MTAGGAHVGTGTGATGGDPAAAGAEAVSERRCTASICQVRGYGHGHTALEGRPVWSVTWQEGPPAGARIRRGCDYCSPECRTYGEDDTLE